MQVIRSLALLLVLFLALPIRADTINKNLEQRLKKHDFLDPQIQMFSQWFTAERVKSDYRIPSEYRQQIAKALESKLDKKKIAADLLGFWDKSANEKEWEYFEKVMQTKVGVRALYLVTKMIEPVSQKVKVMLKPAYEKTAEEFLKEKEKSSKGPSQSTKMLWEIYKKTKSCN